MSVYLNFEKDFKSPHDHCYSISSLDGFNKKKGHFIPTDVNDYADTFVKRLLDDDEGIIEYRFSRVCC